jgi:Uma2 family endonuclease
LSGVDVTTAEPLSMTRCSVDESLRFERGAEAKHDYRDGRIVPTLVGSPDHSLITANVTAEVGTRIRGTGCLAYASTLRLFVPPDVGHGLGYTYPDAMVICGRPALDAADDLGHTATNPRLIVEVLSPSTEAYDRGEKFRRYLRIPSFEEYVLVSQVVPVVETYTRQADGSWTFRAFEGLEVTAQLRSLEIDLPLAEVFAGVEFPSPADGPTSPPAP